MTTMNCFQSFPVLRLIVGYSVLLASIGFVASRGALGQDPEATEQGSLFPEAQEPAGDEPMAEPAAQEGETQNEGEGQAAPAAKTWHDSFQWRHLGPTVFGGRIVDIEVDPLSASTIYAAAGSGGLWKSVNRGTTWSCIFENEATTSIGDIALAPSNPDVIYVGTGEANNQRSSYWGNGVYRSDDAGKTWTHLGLTQSQHIARIVVSPADPNVLYVASMGPLYSRGGERGVFRSVDGGQTWEQTLDAGPTVGATDLVIDPSNPSILFAATYERSRSAWNFEGAGPGSGIWRSTDGGSSWQRLNNGLPSGDLGRIGLAIFPGDTKQLYAMVPNANRVVDAKSVGQPEPQEDGTVRLPFGISVRFNEGAASISAIVPNSPAAQARVPSGRTIAAIGEVAISTPEDLTTALNQLRPGDRFRLTLKQDDQEQSFDLTLPAEVSREVGGEFYRSSDGGETWAKVNEQSVGGEPDYYYGQVRVAPDDPNKLWVLGVPVMVSSDGGVKWSSDGATSVHVDHHALWINPADSKHLLLGNDGGLHVSYDAGKNWDHLNQLPLAQFYAIGVDMQVPYHVYGGTQDNGTWGGPSRSRNPRGVSSADWYRVGGGDGFYVQVDPTNSDIMIGESQFGALYRRHRPTGQTRGIRPGQSDEYSLADRYNWNSPLLMSRYDSRVLYYGANRLFKSYNQGDRWEVISPDLTTNDPQKIAGNVPHCTITTIAESPFEVDELLVGTDDGLLQWTIDGGKNWTNVTNRLPFKSANWWCSRVVFSTHDRNTAYATFTGYRADDFRPFVYRTRDRGQTWESIAADLPQEPINVLLEDPTNANMLYVGTEFGVYASLDAGTSWQRLGSNLPRLAIHDLLIHPREHDLIAGSHAQGFFVIDDITALGAWKTLATEEVARLAPVRDTIRWSPIGTEVGSGNRLWLARNPIDGVYVSYWLESSHGRDEVELAIKNEAGEVVRQLQAEPEAGFHRIAWEFDPRRSQNRGGGRRGGRQGPTRPVTPGRYTAVLTVGEKVWEESFEVQADPILETLRGPAR